MGLDAKDKIALEGLEHRFTYHAPQPDQITHYQKIRTKALELAQVIVTECPSSPERSSALTNLDATVFFANAAIARDAGGEPAEQPGG
jgi:hypothetical protein